MKRLLLLTFLCVVPSAHAVDYVKCEAMQKALGRTNNTAFQVWKSAHISAERQYGLDNASAIANKDPEYLAAVKRVDKIQADYDAAGCY